MDKDQFWTVEKLIPRISTPSFSNEKKSTGVSIRLLEYEDPKKDFGPQIKNSSSKVVRSFQLTPPLAPKTCDITSPPTVNQTVPFVSCYQFNPTYSDLNTQQKQYFSFFLKTISEQKKVLTCFPYLQLYLCKVIRENLDKAVLPQNVFWVWKTYRKEFPLVDKLFADSVCDFSFFAKTTPPYQFLGDIFVEKDFTAKPILLEMFIFDYLFAPNHTISAKESNLILRSVTQESFRKSKAYRSHQNFSLLIEKAISKAISAGLFNRPSLNESIFRIQIPSEVRVERKLFPGLPQSEIPFVEISMRYVPLLRDENIRSRLDEVVRYLENRVRKILKLKNSLSRIHISAQHQAFLDEILLEYEFLAKQQEETSSQEEVTFVPYKPRELEIDFNKASQIEENSWDLTQALTEGYTNKAEESIVIGGACDETFDLKYKEDLDRLECKSFSGDGSEFWEFASLLSETEDNFMRVVINESPEIARQFCVSNGVFFEALILSCNEKSQQTIDDCIFDSAGKPFPDYIDSLQNVFPPMKGEV